MSEGGNANEVPPANLPPEGAAHFRFMRTPTGKASTSLEDCVTTLDEFEQHLVEYRIGGKDGPAIIPAILKDCPEKCRGMGTKDCGGNHAHRLNSNVTHMTGLALDCDNLSEQKYNELIDAIERSNLYAFMWQSFSCKAPDDYRCRVLIPFQDPLPIASADDWSERVWPALVASLGPEFSSIPSIQACKDPARLYFLPAKSRPELVREAMAFPGPVWDPTKVVAVAVRVEAPAVPRVEAPETDDARPVDLGKIRERLARIDTGARDICQALLLGKSLTPPPRQRQPHQPTRYEAWRTATSTLSLVLEGWESSKAALEILRASFVAMASESPEDHTAWDVIEDLLETARASAAQYKAERAAEREQAIEAMRTSLGKRAAMAQQGTPPTPDPTVGAGSPPTEEIDTAEPPQERWRNSWELTDLGNAERLWDWYGNHNRYVPKRKEWLSWDGKIWSADGPRTIYACHHEATRKLRDIAKECDDEEMKTEIVKHARKGESNTATVAAVAQASRLPEFSLGEDAFDKNPFLLNVENGTIDLRTGEIQPHVSGNFITKLAPVTYDKTAPAPRFERFIEEILPNVETRSYVQKVLGYCITGSVSEELIFFAHGDGRNGKSKLLEVVARVLGGYAQLGAEGLLEASKNDRHPTEIAELRGARFVLNSETQDSVSFNEKRLKTLTDASTKGRHMGKDFSTFATTHKIVMHGNHKPRVNGQDAGLWRRMVVIPFNVQFDKNRDDQLAEKLWAEASGILNWLIAGCLAWQAATPENGHRLVPPPEVIAATDEYKQEEDSLLDFLPNCVEMGPEFSITLHALHSEHTEWLRVSGERPWTNKGLARALRDHGYTMKHGRTGTIVQGMKIRLGRDMSGAVVGGKSYGQARV